MTSLIVRVMRASKRQVLGLCAAAVCVACAGSAAVERPQANSSLPGALLCVARHAQAYKNLSPPPEGMSTEALDRLTPVGVSRARVMGAELGEGPWRVWSAPAGRVRETALGMAAAAEVSVLPELRPISGEIAWEERLGMWARGLDGRPEGGESLADGQARVLSVLAHVRRELGEGGRGVVVTHGDIAALLLGEVEGTPLLERPRVQMLDPGALRCVRL